MSLLGLRFSCLTQSASLRNRPITKIWNVRKAPLPYVQPISTAMPSNIPPPDERVGRPTRGTIDWLTCLPA